MILVCTRGHILNSEYMAHWYNHRTTFESGDGARCPLAMGYDISSNTAICGRKMTEVSGERISNCCGYDIFFIAKYYVAVDEIKMVAVGSDKDLDTLCDRLRREYCNNEDV